MFSRFLVISTITVSSLAAEEAKVETTPVSEAFGHLIAKNISSLGLDLDMELVLKGMKDQKSGKDSPMTEEECIQAISAARQALFNQKAESNLQLAETFLKENAKNTEVVSLEEGKVQYKVEKKGEGAKVEANFSPLIRYVGKYLDGSIFGESSEAEVLSLTDSIPGFSKGLVGMQEGEKRTLYIHPELAYGTKGRLSPNSLLTFEVEVVKANTIEENLSDSLIIESLAEPNAQALDAPAVR